MQHTGGGSRRERDELLESRDGTAPARDLRGPGPERHERHVGHPLPDEANYRGTGRGTSLRSIHAVVKRTYAIISLNKVICHDSACNEMKVT